MVVKLASKTIQELAGLTVIQVQPLSISGAMSGRPLTSEQLVHSIS